MEDQEIRQRLDALQQAIERTEKMCKRLYQFFLFMVIGSAIAFIIPLIGLAFAVPSFIQTYTSISNIQ